MKTISERREGSRRKIRRGSQKYGRSKGRKQHAEAVTGRTNDVREHVSEKIEKVETMPQPDINRLNT